MKIHFKIDEKSLFYGIKNDYKRGQSATVATPINQSKNPANWHHDILKLTEHGIELETIPIDLIKKCTPKTTSKANSKINYFFEFSKISVDGIPLDCHTSFGMYIKEETDEYIIDRNGYRTHNTHYGRIKLHYPTSLYYKDKTLNIDNNNVLEAILSQNGNFAFVVRAFEYDLETKVLNFITTLVGPKDIPLSKVFVRQKGTGNKLLTPSPEEEIAEYFSDYAISTKEISPEEALSIYESAGGTRRENGALGEQIIFDMLAQRDNIEELCHVSDKYPQSPYDIEYVENGTKKYVEVKATQTKDKVFNMSNGEINFMNKFRDDYTLYLITNIKASAEQREIFIFQPKDIDELRSVATHVRFYA